MSVGNNFKVANPVHIKKSYDNVHYSMYSIESSQPDEVINDPLFFSRCASILLPFDRIQVLNKLDNIITEFIVQSSNIATEEVKVLKISKIDLLNGKIQFFDETKFKGTK